MTKDAYYFPHDSNAKDDPKIMLLIDQLGLEGYGIFWVLIETLRDQKDYKCNLNLLPVISRRYNTSLAKVEAIIKSFNLFVIEDDSFFYSHSLIRRMEPLHDKREKARLAGLQSAENRRKKLGLPTVAQQTLNDCSTDAQQAFNDCSTSKEKQSKEEESKVNESKSNEINTACVNDLMNYFSFTEVANFDKFRTINQFVTLLSTTGRLDYFKAQFEAYRLFKDKSGQLKHGFKSFIGSIDNHFADGGWDAENWSEKLKTVSEPDQQQPYSAADVSRRVADRLKSELQ